MGTLREFWALSGLFESYLIPRPRKQLTLWLPYLLKAGVTSGIQTNQSCGGGGHGYSTAFKLPLSPCSPLPGKLWVLPVQLGQVIHGLVFVLLVKKQGLCDH